MAVQVVSTEEIDISQQGYLVSDPIDEGGEVVRQANLMHQHLVASWTLCWNIVLDIDGLVVGP